MPAAFLATGWLPVSLSKPVSGRWAAKDISAWYLACQQYECKSPAPLVEVVVDLVLSDGPHSPSQPTQPV